MDETRKQMLEFISENCYVAEVYKVGSFGFPPNYSYHRHKHPEIEIFHMLDGRCTMIVEEEVVKFQPGDSIIIYPHIEHNFSVASEGACYISQLEFQQKLPNPIPNENAFFAEIRERKITHAIIPKSKKIGKYIEEIAKETQKQSENQLEHSLSRLSLDLMFVQLFLHLSWEIERVRRNNKALGKDKYQKVLLYISENYTESLNMDEICANFSVSSRYIRRRFSEDLGITSSQYIKLIRITKAKEFLSIFHHTITDVAFMTGFNNSQYFSRVFKEQTDMCPTAYRAMVTKDNKPIA